MENTCWIAKMIPVYVQAYSCFSSVGNEINLQMENIKHGKRGLLFRESSGLYKTYAGFIADVDSSRFIQSENLSRLESLVVCNLQETLKRSGWTEGDEEPELILCTTKGNIDTPCLLPSKIDQATGSAPLPMGKSEG